MSCATPSFDFNDDLTANTSAMRRLMRSFLASTFLVVGGVGGWASLSQIESAVLAQGTFVVKTSAQSVQHLEGGVVGAILVKDGQHVEEGQILIRLDAAKVIADSAIRERRLMELSAEKARLDAERQDSPAILAPPPPIDKPQARAAYKALLAAQENLMHERRWTRSSQLSQLSERKRQIQSQIAGLNETTKALQEEMSQAAGELADLRTLDAKGLVRRPVLRQSERDVSRVRGQIGDMESRIAGAKSQLIETEFKIAEITRSTRSDVLSKLQEITAQLAEVEEDGAATVERLRRLEIRAPRAGLVQELAVHTIGGVVGAGQKLLSIIPTTDPLIVTAKIPPDEINQVRIGQEATVRISAFRMPVTPELSGRVEGLSADQVTDERSGRPYFAVKIAITPGEQSKLEGKELTPGLPAEVMILGESRRVISYVLQPLTDKLTLALREK